MSSPVTGNRPPASLGELMDPARARPSGRPPVRAGRSRRAVAGETVVAALISAGVALGMNWQIVRSLGRALPGLGPDPFLQAWSLGWSAHALKTPLTRNLLNGNAFYPAHDGLAFADPLLGLGPLALPFGESHLATAFGVIVIVSTALSALGAYALARQLGVQPLAAAVAGAGFAFPVWRLGQLAELGVLATGPMVLALAMLARGHGIRWRPVQHRSDRPPGRPLWALLGWVAACWQLTLGLTHGLPFAYLLAGLLVLSAVLIPVHAWFFRRTSPITRLVVLADVAGAGAFSGVAWFMASAYARVADAHGAAMDAAWSAQTPAVASGAGIGTGSGWAGLIAPPDVHGTWSWITGGASLREGLFGSTFAGSAGTSLGSSLDGTARLLPGAVLVLLALAGLVVSAWRWRWRVVLIGSALVTGGLAAGRWGGFVPFAWLRQHAPGWDWARSPAPVIAFTTLALALLAAGFVSRIAGSRPVPVAVPEPSDGSSVSIVRHRSPSARAGLALGVVLPFVVLAEGWGTVPMSTVPEVPRAMQVATGPAIVLPSVATNESRIMYLSAVTGFPALANGQAWFTPESLDLMRQQLRDFPGVVSVAYLREHGIRSVVVLTGNQGTTEWSTATRAPAPELGLKRAIYDDSMLYQFR